MVLYKTNTKITKKYMIIDDEFIHLMAGHFGKAVAFLDVKFNIIYFNHSFENMLYNTKKGDSIFNVMKKYGLEKDFLIKKFDLSHKNKIKISFSHVYQSKNKIFGFDFTVAPFRYEEIAILFTFQDVSVELSNVKKFNETICELNGKKGKQGELEKTNEDLSDFKLALDNSSNSIIITLADGTIEYVNKGFEKNMGYSINESIGKNSTQLQSTDPDNPVYNEITETLKKGETWVGELQNKRKNGDIIWERATVSPIFGDNNKIQKYVTVKENIDKEIELKENLLQSIKKLQILDKKKDEFVSMVTHELRSPLTVIRSYVDTMINNSSLNELQKKKFLERVLFNVTNLIELVNDILDMSKIDAGEMTFKFEQVNINDFIGNIIEDVEQLYKEKNISLVLKNNINKLIEVNTDKDKLKRVLVNLLSNSFKFTPKDGKVVVSINKNNDNCLQISVKDNGIGIPEKDIETIFERFKQVDNKFQNDYKGTGLGLALVKDIIRGLNGEIWVKSDNGNGAEFIFTLPFKSEI